MSLNNYIMLVMGIGVLLGGIDRIFNNRFGLGKQFEEGFMCLGPTALSIVGVICISPLLSSLLSPIIVPLYHLMGADPSMFASIFAIDMGGYPLAMELAETPLIGAFSGIIVSTMLGATIVFTIPTGLGMIAKAYHANFAKGLLIGLVPIPIGSFVGGLMMGLSVKQLLLNSVPTLLIGLFLMIGLIFKQELMVKGFLVFGTFIKIITTIGLTLAAFTYLTGITTIPNMPDIMNAMETTSSICIVLLGSLPLVHLLLNVLQRPFERLGEKLSLNGPSIAGMLFSCISVFPVFKIFPEMNERGQIVCTAFFVSSIAVFAAHLGYTAGVAPEYLTAMIVAKLCSGFLGVVLALFFTRNHSVLS